MSYASYLSTLDYEGILQYSRKSVAELVEELTSLVAADVNPPRTPQQRKTMLTGTTSKAQNPLHVLFSGNVFASKYNTSTRKMGEEETVGAFNQKQNNKLHKLVESFIGNLTAENGCDNDTFFDLISQRDASNNNTPLHYLFDENNPLAKTPKFVNLLLIVLQKIETLSPAQKDHLISLVNKQGQSILHKMVKSLDRGALNDFINAFGNNAIRKGLSISDRNLETPYHQAKDSPLDSQPVDKLYILLRDDLFPASGSATLACDTHTSQNFLQSFLADDKFSDEDELLHLVCQRLNGRRAEAAAKEDKKGQNALYLACEAEGNAKAIAITHGMPPADKISLASTLTKKGRNALHLSIIKKDGLQKTQAILQDLNTHNGKISLVGRVTKNKNNALHLACKSKEQGHKKTKLVLHGLSVEEKFDLARAVTARGWNALHYACRSGDIKKVNTILTGLDDVQKNTLLSSKTKQGETVLHVAARTGSKEMVRHVMDFLSPAKLHEIAIGDKSSVKKIEQALQKNTSADAMKVHEFKLAANDRTHFFRAFNYLVDRSKQYKMTTEREKDLTSRINDFAKCILKKSQNSEIEVSSAFISKPKFLLFNSSENYHVARLSFQHATQAEAQAMKRYLEANTATNPLAAKIHRAIEQEAARVEHRLER